LSLENGQVTNRSENGLPFSTSPNEVMNLTFQRISILELFIPIFVLQIFRRLIFNILVKLSLEYLKVLCASLY